MIGISATIDDNTQAISARLEKASVRLVGHAAASTRKRAIESIEPSDEPSPPGSPPHTRIRTTKAGKSRPGQIQRAIAYAHDKSANVAVVGPRHSVLGEAGQAHEFGGEFRGEDYDQRAFMGPALDATQTKFGDSFAGSLGTN